MYVNWFDVVLTACTCRHPCAACSSGHVATCQGLTLTCRLKVHCNCPASDQLWHRSWHLQLTGAWPLVHVENIVCKSTRSCRCFSCAYWTSVMCPLWKLRLLMWSDRVIDAPATVTGVSLCSDWTLWLTPNIRATDLLEISANELWSSLS